MKNDNKDKKKKREKEERSNGGSFLDLEQETTNGIWGVIALGLAVVTTLALFNKAGSAGAAFSGFVTSLFGWGVFLVPLSLLILSAAFFKSIHRKIYASAFIGTGLFVLGFLGIFYIMRAGDMAQRISQGGYLGLVLGYPLLRFLGSIASFILLLVLLFVSILVALNIPVHKLAFWIKEENTDEEATAVKAEATMEDKIIVKRGNQIVDTKAEEEAQKQKGDFHPQIMKPRAQQKSQAEEEREFVIKASKSGKWELPPLEILSDDKDQPRAADINTNAAIIKRTLANFGIEVEMGEVSIGPTVTQFTLRPSIGVKLSRITALHSDLSLALAAHPIRIEAPIPGKSLVGIEVPNKKMAIVGLRDLLEADDYKKSKFFLPLVLGRDVAGFPVYTALEKMPHMLIAGATGTGKSVAINTVLLSLLYKHSPDMLKLILVDPKRVELSLYNNIPHLITPVIVDPKKVVNAMRWAVREMERRYERLAEGGSRDIFSYNAKQVTDKKELMPFIVIIIDELADLMAAHGRDIEATIVRLAQMARAVGIHLIVSTQRPSVEVITGLIKANITSRIALQVASQIDSRTILDSGGAERLLGHGDMLYQSNDTNSKLKRVQGAFITEKEVKDVVKFIKDQAAQMDDWQEETTDDKLKADIEAAVSGASAGGDDEDAGDELFSEAKEVVMQAGKASASLLQRRLKVGYARAARLLDLLEEKGLIGPGEGAKPREVYMKADGSRDASGDLGPAMNDNPNPQ